MAGNDGFATLLLNGIEDFPVSDEPFNQGVVAVVAVEPFDQSGAVVAVASVEPFWQYGVVAVVSVEPFDQGQKVSVVTVEPFDQLGASDAVIPSVDLGDGDTTPGTAKPIYGWWSDAADVNEDLGVVETE